MCILGSSLYDVYRMPFAAGQTDTLHAKEPALPAPDFTFTDIYGDTHHLSDFRGRVVLLNFWATWCAPCVTEFPKLIDLTSYYDGNVVLIAISADIDNKTVSKFLADHRADIKIHLKAAPVIIALDKNHAITRDIFATEKYPETIIITPDQKMARRVIGDTDWYSTDTYDFINTLFAEVRTKSH